MMINLNTLTSFLSSVQHGLESIVHGLENAVHFFRDYLKGVNDSIAIHEGLNTYGYPIGLNHTGTLDTQVYEFGRVSGDLVLLAGDIMPHGGTPSDSTRFAADLVQLVGDLSAIRE